MDIQVYFVTLLVFLLAGKLTGRHIGWNLDTDGNLECLFHKGGSFYSMYNNLCGDVEEFKVISDVSVGRHWRSAWSIHDTTSGPQSFYRYYGNVPYLDFHFAYYDAPRNGKAGDQEAFVSPVIKTPGPACVSFVYYMYGADLGSLYLVVKYNETEVDQRVQIDENNLRLSHQIVEKLIARGDQGKRWIEKKFQVAYNGETHFQLFFTPIRGSGPKSKVGLDTIIVSNTILNCPRDGEWTHWSNYGDCNTAGGNAVKERHRNCSNPEPSGGGAFCLLKNFTRGSFEKESITCTATQKPATTKAAATTGTNAVDYSEAITTGNQKTGTTNAPVSTGAATGGSTVPSTKGVTEGNQKTGTTNAPVSTGAATGGSTVPSTKGVTAGSAKIT